MSAAGANIYNFNIRNLETKKKYIEELCWHPKESLYFRIKVESKTILHTPFVLKHPWPLKFQDFFPLRFMFRSLGYYWWNHSFRSVVVLKYLFIIMTSWKWLFCVKEIKWPLSTNNWKCEWGFLLEAVILTCPLLSCDWRQRWSYWNKQLVLPLSSLTFWLVSLFVQDTE